MRPGEKSFSRLSEKIKAVRAERQMTQAALSEGIVTRNMLSRIENGAALPSLPVLCALADRLGMPVGFFIDDHDDGSDARNRRLLDLALEEYTSGHFDSCLNFCLCLEDYIEIKEALILHCRYRIALENMYAGRLTAAQRGFADCAREAKKGVVPQSK